MEKRLEVPLRAAVEFLEEHGYRYALIGGIAVSQWGFVRVTRDVDIKVLVPDTEYPAARAALRAAFPEPARTHAPRNPLIVLGSLPRPSTSRKSSHRTVTCWLE